MRNLDPHGLLGSRVRERETGRIGTVKVVLNLDWPEVEWDDKKGSIDLIHSSKIERVEGDSGS